MALLGVEWILRELVEPFERMPAAGASALVESLFGITPLALELLETERDDSFRVRAAEGDYVLKVAHPGDDPALIELQALAMRRALADGVPVQRLIEPVAEPSVGGRAVRLLTWLPGTLLGRVSPTLEEVQLLGAALGRLGASVAGLDHPAAHRTIAWDLQSLALLRGAPRPDATTPAFDAMDGVDVASLPRQFIHNDFNLGNVLVDADDSRYVVGILDFGDALVGPRVQDVAVALAYLVPESGDPTPVIDAFVAGYGRLTRAELAALPLFIGARLAQRIILPPLLGDDDPARTERLIRTLENLQRTP